MVNQTTERQNLELAKDILEKEITYWNEKRWRIFSWSNNLLAGGIAGATALFPTQEVDNVVRAIIVIAVIIVTFYSIAWLNYSLNIRDSYRRQLWKVYCDIGLSGKVKPLNELKILTPIISYELTVFSLGIITSSMIAIPIFLK